MLKNRGLSIAKLVASNKQNEYESATVIAVGGKTVDIQMASGGIYRRVPISGSASVGDSVSVLFLKGKPSIIAGGSSGTGVTQVIINNGTEPTPSGDFAPSPHDALGPHHSWPTASAGQVFAAPASSSGTPSFRALATTDLPTLTVSAGNGLTGGGNLPSVTLNVGAGDGIVVDASAVAVNLATASGLNTTSGLAISTSGSGTGLSLASNVLKINVDNGIEISGNSVGIATGSDTGLTLLSSVLNVKKDYPFVWTATHRFTNGLNVGTATAATGGNAYISGSLGVGKNAADYPLDVVGDIYSSASVRANISVITQELTGAGASTSVSLTNGTGFKSSQYVSGFAGNGWRIYRQDNSTKAEWEVDNLTVRGTLSAYELLIQQIRATNGSVFVSAAAKIDSVSGTGPYTLIVEGGSSDYAPFAVGDVIRAQRVSLGTSTLVWQSDLTVTAINVDANPRAFTATLRSGSTAPAEGMEYVRLGNTTDANRQGAVYLTADDSGAPFIDIVDGITSHADWGAAGKVKSRIGRLNGILGGATANYGIWSGTGTSNTDSWVKMAEDGILLNNVPLKMYSSGNQTVDFASNGNLKIGTNVANSSTTALSWDGSVLSVKGSVTITGGSGYSNITDKPTSIYDINKPEFSFLTTMSRMVFSETFSGVSATASGSVIDNTFLNWEVQSSQSGYQLQIVNLADNSSTIGGSVLRVTKAVRLINKTLIPYHPKKIYRSRVILRRFTNSAFPSYVTLGFTGVGADGSTIVSPTGGTDIQSHDHITSAQQPTEANGWKTYTGYTSGYAATGAYTTATIESPTSVANPGEMHTNVRYLRPYMQLNWSTTDGVIDVDSFIVESYDIPSDAGLYMNPQFTGYWDGANWKTYMSNNGSFYLSGSSGTQGLTWDSTNNALSIDGAITARSGSIAGVLSIGTNGEIRQGTGSLTASPATYTGLRVWAETSGVNLFGRIGGYNNGVLQWYAGTDGKLYAGGGDVIIDSSGISIDASGYGAYGTNNSITWKSQNSSGNLVSSLYMTSYDNGDRYFSEIRSVGFTSSIPFKENVLRLWAESNSTSDGSLWPKIDIIGRLDTLSESKIKLRASVVVFESSYNLEPTSVFIRGGLQFRGSGSIVESSLLPDGFIGTFRSIGVGPNAFEDFSLGNGDAKFEGGLNVGSATGAAAGEIRASGNITSTVASNPTLTLSSTASGGGSRVIFQMESQNAADYFSCVYMADGFPRRVHWIYNATGANTTPVLSMTSANRVGIAIAGSPAGIPGYTLDVGGDINASGVYRVSGTQVVGARKTGWAAATGTATRTTFATGTVTTAQLAERVKALVDDLISHGLIGA